MLRPARVRAPLVLLFVATTVAASAEARPGRTERVSVAHDGAEALGSSLDPSLSADGRFVAFQSDANLVPEDPDIIPKWDVYLRDLSAGTTELVSVGTDGTSATGGRASISADGRFVAFDSASTSGEIVPGVTQNQVFVRDRAAGTTEVVSVTSDGAPGAGNSYAPSISADGRYVAFLSGAPDLVPGVGNESFDYFVHDRETGLTERISVARDGTEQNCNPVPTSYVRMGCPPVVWAPSISADGRYVAFPSFASTMVPDDTNGVADVFVRNLETGTVERVSVSTEGLQGNGNSYLPALSGNGRYVAFYSLASNLIPEDTNGAMDAFVHDRWSGRTERASIGSDGEEARCPPDPNFLRCDQTIWPPSISADGRFVAFMDYATGLVPGDANSAWDIFVRDRVTGTTERASAAVGGGDAAGHSNGGVLSADGRIVGFRSYAANLIDGDGNGKSDVFVRRRGPAVGVGEIRATLAGDRVDVTGWVSLLGQTVTSANDPSDDGTGLGEREAGGELIGAALVYRPERSDLLVRFVLWRLASGSVPGLLAGTGPPSIAGTPGIVYDLTFEVGGTDYAVRASRAEPSAPPGAPYFALYRCAGPCSEVRRLTGTIGGSGHEVLVRLPLEAIGAAEGATLKDIEAMTGRTVDATGGFVFFDRLTLPGGSIGETSVALGIAPAGTPAAEVPFEQVASLAGGSFSGSLTTGSLAGGGYDVWARTCLGSVCDAASVPIEL